MTIVNIRVIYFDGVRENQGKANLNALATIQNPRVAHRRKRRRRGTKKQLRRIIMIRINFFTLYFAGRKIMANLKLVHSICIVLFLASQAASLALPHRSRGGQEDRGSRSPKYRNQIVSSRAGKFYNLSRIPFFSFHLIPPFSDMFQIKREIFNHCLVKIKMGNAEFVCSLGTAPRLVEPTWARVSIDFILVVVANCPTSSAQKNWK